MRNIIELEQNVSSWTSDDGADQICSLYQILRRYSSWFITFFTREGRRRDRTEESSSLPLLRVCDWVEAYSRSLFQITTRWSQIVIPIIQNPNSVSRLRRATPWSDRTIPYNERSESKLSRQVPQSSRFPLPQHLQFLMEIWQNGSLLSDGSIATEALLIFQHSRGIDGLNRFTARNI